jgi:HAMP domain-containing protein
LPERDSAGKPAHDEPSGDSERPKRPSTVREISALLRASDDDEPTNPNLRVPARVAAEQGLAASPQLSRDEQTQLAGIIGAWVSAAPSDRLLMAEFARRIVGTRAK